MKDKILVTGGAGYIGSFIVNELLDLGHHVTVLDSLVYGDAGLNAFISRDNVSFVKGDITDIKALDKALEGVTKVIALAAIVGDPACSISRDVTWDVNYNSTKLLIDRAKAHKIERLVFASSCSVYGSSEASENKILDENSELNPVSAYAETRVLSEELLLSDENTVCSTILRLSTVFGLSPRMRFDLAVNIMSAKGVYDKAIDVFGGEQWRPFVHVQDVAHAFVLSINAPKTLVDKEIFNVGSSDSNYQIQDIAKIIEEEIPETIATHNSSMIDARNYNVNFTKIHKALNFKTRFSVRDGVREMRTFVEENRPDLSHSNFNNFTVWKEIINGQKFIPYAVPDVGEEEINEVINTINSGWLTTGPKTKLFEEKVKEYFQDDELEVIAVSSCTAALHLQLLAAGVGPGDEVITTPLTFCATINTILQVGATPILVDIDPDTFNLDLSRIEEAITTKTVAIIPVYYAGQAVNNKELSKIAKRHNLLVLADAAHAMGAKYGEKHCGTYEDSAAFSFYATKNMVTGEGGMVTTKNKDWAEKMRRLALHGMNKDAWKRFSSAGNWYYEISDIGYKYNFTDIQSSFGLHQLNKIDSLNQRRREYGALYDELLKDLPGIKLHKLDPASYSTRHLYPIVIDEKVCGISRDELINRLKEKNIGTSVHYVPIHYHPAYQSKLGLSVDDFEITNNVYKGLLSLPLYTKMEDADIRRVAAAVSSILG
jgi:dTDP-4-amino-4,6-dideoxygalactose transaminase/nucleoside-diphosphate-sugar epimerase